MEASDAAALDAREQALRDELTLLGELAKVGIGAASVSHMQGSLAALTAKRPEAMDLARAGRTELAVKLEEAIVYLEGVLDAVGAASGSPLTDEEREAVVKNRASIAGTWKETTAADRKAIETRQQEFRKLL